MTQRVQVGRVETPQARYHQPELWTAAPEFGKQPQQTVEILVRVQRRNGEQEPFRTPDDLKKIRLDAQWNQANLILRQPVKSFHILACRLRIRDQDTRNVRRPEQQPSPEGQIKPAKMFRMPLMLQIVKNSNLRAAAENRRGKARVQQDVNPPRCNGEGQRQLFPSDPRGPETGPHRLWHGMEIGLLRRQRIAGFKISKEKIFVAAIDLP